MEEIKNLLTQLSQSFQAEILDYYQRFYSYSLYLFEHKNIDIDLIIIRNNEENHIKIINMMVETIISALNSIGINSKSIDFKDNLTKEFLLASKTDLKDYKDLFKFVGQNIINANLLKIIIEYIIEIDTKKLENLDLFDLLPDNFKLKLDELKRNFFFQEKELIKIQAFFPSIEKIIDPITLKIRTDENSDKINEDMDILKKLHDAKERNIEVLKTPVLPHIQNSKEQNSVFLSLPEQRYESLQGEYYFDLYGNLPDLNNKVKNLLKINLKNLDSLALKPEFLDLESLFYYISIHKIYGLSLPFKTEEIITILEGYISGKVFSTGKYHISNPLSNFFGLSILSELNLLNDLEIIDLLDIEMFLENELKSYLPEKLMLNYFSLLSLRILEKWGVVLTEKRHLLSEQINFRQINNDEGTLPLDLLCHLSIIKLLDNKTDLTLFKKIYLAKLNLLITKEGLINDNLTDTARVLLIFKMLNINYKEEPSVNVMLNSIITKAFLFQNNDATSPFHWSNDKLTLKAELRMAFWLLIALLQFEYVFDFMI